MRWTEEGPEKGELFVVEDEANDTPLRPCWPFRPAPIKVTSRTVIGPPPLPFHAESVNFNLFGSKLGKASNRFCLVPDTC